MDIRTDLKDTILEEDTNRYCEIYKITNLINNKMYIGQAVSHILNHGKYRPYGLEKRFKCHVSEAMSTKKNQCHYLNNAIRKYGESNFSVQLLVNCTCEDADKCETEEILKCNTLFPTGYNLKTGGKRFTPTTESKKRVSDGVVEYFKDKRFCKFDNLNVTDIDLNEIESYLRPLNRHGSQYGWYVYIQRTKTDFGGVHLDLDESKERAYNFIHDLKKYLEAKHLVAGNPLEPSLPLLTGNG